MSPPPRRNPIKHNQDSLQIFCTWTKPIYIAKALPNVPHQEKNLIINITKKP